MSKTAKIIAGVAAIVALAVTGVGLIMGPAAFAATFGTSAATIAAVAGAVGAVAGMVAQATMKPPDMKGTVSQVMIGKNLPVILALGTTYIGGMLIYDKSAPPSDNKNRTQIMVGTAAGPIEEFIEFYGDYTAISFTGSDWDTGRVATGYYGADGGYLWLNARYGLRPDTALVEAAGRPSFRDWDSDYKLSGYAAWSVTMEFDEDGRRYSSGVPQWGMKAKWVKIYDPRKDSTYPGGIGTQRWDDESTFAFGTAGVGTVAQGENPALHALTYARGRFIEKDALGAPLAAPVKICGVGLPWEAIKVEDFVELANICDANGWTCGGAVYEGPGLSKWDNLKRILQAAAAEPVWSGGVLSLRFHSPKTPLFTITADSLADGDVEIRAMQGWRDRINSCVPRVRLETHKWEYEQLEAVTGGTYVTEDGELKTKEVQYDLVQNEDQGAALAAYEVANGREFGPIRVPLKPEFLPFRPGEAGNVDLASLLGDAGLGTQLCTIIGREVDPGSGIVTLTLESETTAKHAWALGQTGVVPPTPTLVTPQEMDEAVAGGDPAISSMPDLVPVVINADHTGAVLAGQLPRNVAAKRLHGGADVTTDSAWSATTDSGTITYSIGAATGVLEITAIGSAEAVVTVTSVYSGITVSRKLKVTKLSAQPPQTGGGGGTSATDTSFGSVSSTSMTAISDELTVTVGAAGQVALSCSLEVTTDEVAPDATYPVDGRWQWWDGAAWVDQGASDTNSSPDCVVTEHGPVGDEYYTVAPGALSVSATKSGLTTGTSHKFRLRAKNTSGTRTMYFTGTASAAGS